MDNTIIQQGRFTSAGAAKTIVLRSDVDWIRVFNKTVAAASQTTAVGVEYYWQRGMANGEGIEYKKSNAANAANLTAYLSSGGFTLVDSSVQTPGALNNGSTGVSGFTAANPGVVTVGSTSGMAAGAIVRFSSLDNQPQYNGIDFSVGYGTFTGTTFSVDYLNSTGTVASTDGDFRVIPFNPMFYPRRRVITNITAAASAVITLSVDHGYTVGQEVRFALPGGSSLWGNYAQMDGQSATITAVNTATGAGNNTITVNFDTSTFGTFAFPGASAVPFTPAEVIPFGEDTAQALSSSVDILGDATVNSGYIGIQLAAGANSPAGQNNDVIYWVAGKSFSVDNQ